MGTVARDSVLHAWIYQKCPEIINTLKCNNFMDRTGSKSSMGVLHDYMIKVIAVFHTHT